MSTSAKTLAAAIAECVAVKESTRRRPRYVVELKHALQQFARGQEDRHVEEIGPADINDWLSEASTDSTRMTRLSRLSTFFGFCRHRGYVDTNPTDRIDRIRIDRPPPAILSPAQVAALMNEVRRRKPYQLAFWALSFFAGIRPDELARLHWTAIDLEEGVIVIDAAASKVRRRRLVYLEASAVAWLRLAAEASATLPVAAATRSRYLTFARSVLGLEAWPHDVARHSAASYLLARHRDAGRVAMTLGNSVRVLEEHYKALVRAKACEAFWGIVPGASIPASPVAVVPQIDPSLPKFARAEAALRVEPKLRAIAMERQHGGLKTPAPFHTIDELRKLANCSRRTMQRVRAISSVANSDLLAALRAGQASVAGAYKRLVIEAPTCAAS